MCRSYGRVGGTLPALDPPLPPYSQPFEGTTSKLCGCASGIGARMPPHRLAGRAGWILLPVLPQSRFVSFGPRYPSGRIPHCDASAAPEVVLAFPAAQPISRWGRRCSGLPAVPSGHSGFPGKSRLFSMELHPESSRTAPNQIASARSVRMRRE